MSNKFIRQIAAVGRQEDGQMAIMVVLILPVVFLFFAMAMDGGLWYFDHRTAQNQADAAVLAAAQFLPAAVDEPRYLDAVDAVDTWLIKNGSGPSDLDCGDERPSPEFMDLHPSGAPDGRLDAVRVCVRRQSPSLFAAISGVPWVYVSAAATARVAPSGLANVKPWAIAPPDPSCGERLPGDPAVLCFVDPTDMYDPHDIDGDGLVGDGYTPEPDGDREPCGYYPPLPGSNGTLTLQGGVMAPETTSLGHTLCPWGLPEDKVHRFKVASKYSPGNFAPIRACGGSGGNVYQDCIEGEASSGFYKVGDSVWVEIETGNMVGPSIDGTDTLYAYESHPVPLYPGGPSSLLLYNGKYEDIWQCDVLATPDPYTGLDPLGKDRADATYVAGREITDPMDGQFYAYNAGDRCAYRLVSIVVIDEFPSGGGQAVVLGVATYSIASWARINQKHIGNSYNGQACGQTDPKDGVGYDCGQIWGYFMQDAKPPDVLLQISETANPFAPVFIAMVE